MKRVWRAALAALLALTPLLGLIPLTASAATLADVHVISRSTGQRLPVHAHGGKLYVAGQPGERYTIQVVNRTSGRILSVVSVDGVNVVSGESASPDQTGYVFSPWQSYEIAGWRKNADEVAAFYFTALADSYAARTGRPDDVGVIGVAVFREWTLARRRPQPHPRESAASEMREKGTAESSHAPASGAHDFDDAMPDAERPGASAPRPLREKLGTGHGEREHSAVAFTDFRRATAQPGQMLIIHYDRYENLVARGIIPGASRFAHPRPFPSAVRFVPDPG